jgi:deoxyribonuclease I
VAALAGALPCACEPTEATRDDAKPSAPTRPVAPTPPPHEQAPAPEPEQPTGGPRPNTPATFEAAVEAAASLWVPAARTFDCGCGFTAGNRVTHGACRYETRADDNAARTLEWAHVVPEVELGGSRPCWTAQGCKDASGAAVSGVSCCLATDEAFARMHADLFNVVPMIQELADDRAGYPFGELDGEPRMYGRCDFEVDHALGEVEPPDAIRGDIARIYLYMADTYPDAVTLSPLQVKRMQAWAAGDPPDADERARAAAITKIQGRPNPWIDADAPPSDPAEGDAKAAEPEPEPEPEPKPAPTGDVAAG